VRVPKAISNTSPLLYLYRGGAIDWLPRLFGEVIVPVAVSDELREGQRRGYDVPVLDAFRWLTIRNPAVTPFEWLSLDLGPGELAAMALALENPDHIVLLDDMLARHTAQAAGLTVWGTLRVLLESKAAGYTDSIIPWIDRLSSAGMWISEDVRRRVLALAGEE
jgi:hypothetical protein